MRSPHEVLLDASEEGLFEIIEESLRRPDIEAYLNLSGVARHVESTGHPETLTWSRSETALRYASFHGYSRIVKSLLDVRLPRAAL